MKEAKTYRGPDYIYPGYSDAPWEELAQLLVSMAPSGLMKAFRATGGSEAVDLALQAAMIHTGRRGFISLEESYHGNSIGGLSVGDSAKRSRSAISYRIATRLSRRSTSKRWRKSRRD